MPAPTPRPKMRRYGTATLPGNLTGTPNPHPTASRPPTSLGRLPAPLRPLPLGHASPPPLCPRHCHQLRRSPPANPGVPLRAMSPHNRRHDAAGPGNAPPAVFQKNRDIAISLAEQGLSYARAGNWVGCVSSTVGKWLGKAPLTEPELPLDGTLELGRLWTRTRSGRTELMVIRAVGGRPWGFRFLGRNEMLPYPLLGPIISMLYCPPSVAPFSAPARRGRARRPCIAALNAPAANLNRANAPHSDLAAIIRPALLPTAPRSG